MEKITCTAFLKNPQLPEMKNSAAATAIELLTRDDERGKEDRHYTFRFTARRHPDDDGCCIAKDVTLTSWIAYEREPWWKRLARWIITL